MTTRNRKSILTHEEALGMIQLAVKKAKELHVQVNIAVVDDGGNLLAFLRMDGAPLVPGKIAQDKAYSAVGFKRPTTDWYENIKDKPEMLHGIVHTDRLTIFGGGLPIYIEGDLVGGIGVAGATSEIDVQCAKAALKKIVDEC